MSLLNDFSRPCVLMNKERKPDGAGGYIVEWTEGAEFTSYQSMNTSMEARRAEKEGVTSLYSALVQKDLPIKYGDFFRDNLTGNTYRVTSNPDESRAPESSSFSLKYFTAERKELPE